MDDSQFLSNDESQIRRISLSLGEVSHRVKVSPSPQATVRGERQSPRVCGEGEHRKEEAEPQQRGASVASSDQPTHVPSILPAAPSFFHLPRPLVPSVLIFTRCRVWLQHLLPRLPAAGSILLPHPQAHCQSKSSPRASRSKGHNQSELLPGPGHTHPQSKSL